MAKSHITSEGMAVVWSVAGISVFQIFWIMFYSIRDMIRSTQNNFILKDDFTVYFVVYMIIALCFKILVVDSYYKEMLVKRRSCSNFIAEYVPQIFIVVGVSIVMFKTM